MGHAISYARHLVNDEPFAVLLPEDLLNEYLCDLLKDNLKDNLKAMIQRYEETGTSQILVEKVDKEDLSSYGIIDMPDEYKTGTKLIHEGQNIKISGFVEKPTPEEAPSNLGIVGRYVLSPLM